MHYAKTKMNYTFKGALNLEEKIDIQLLERLRSMEHHGSRIGYNEMKLQMES